MKRLWLAGGTALVGIFLAAIVLQRPDTGGDVKVPERAGAPKPDGRPLDDRGSTRTLGPGSVRPPDAKPLPEGEPGMTAPPTSEPDQFLGRGGPNPIAAEVAAKRAAPEAVQAGKASVPWTLVRRNLLAIDEPEAKELGGLANQLVLDLRKERRDPDEFPYVELEARQKELAQRVRASKYMSDPEVSQMMDRLDEILLEYHQLKSQGSAPVPDAEAVP